MIKHYHTSRDKLPARVQRLAEELYAAVDSAKRDGLTPDDVLNALVNTLASTACVLEVAPAKMAEALTLTMEAKARYAAQTLAQMAAAGAPK